MKQPSITPWWQPSGEIKPVRVIQSKNNTNFFALAVVIALIAGGVGAAVGRSTTTNIGANLVETKNKVERAPDSIAALAARVIPAVVSISVKGSSGSGTGSGFFLDSNGYVLTNNHVVEAAATSGTITVELSNGKKYGAKLMGRDNSYDLAVLKIDVTSAPTLQLGDSDLVQVGDSVIAIGSPLGLSGTVTSGIISSKNRAVTTGNGNGESSFINALQTDAAINPGNSGGPLTDSLGRMIGINAATATLGSVAGQSGSIGLGFAIPMNQASRVMNEIIANGKATRPVLGVFFDQSFTAGKGAKISSLTPNEGAEKAGIPAGAIITSINGIRITDYVSAIVRIRSFAPGDKVTVIVTMPTGGSKTFTVTLGSAVSN